LPTCNYSTKLSHNVHVDEAILEKLRKYDKEKYETEKDQRLYLINSGSPEFFTNYYYQKKTKQGQYNKKVHDWSLVSCFGHGNSLQWNEK